MAKHIAFWEDCERKARAQNKKRKEKQLSPELFVAPFLWIIAAAASTPMLRRLKVEPLPGWPPGIYAFGDDILRTRIVVASELPRDRSTLLVRIMAGGPGLAEALVELAALTPDAHERTVTEGILVNLQQALGKKPSWTAEEEEFVVRIYATWEKAREEGREEGLKQGRVGAHAEARAKDVLTVLQVRGIAVPDAARQRILAEKGLRQLQRWLKRAVVATSLDEVFDEPS